MRRPQLSGVVVPSHVLAHVHGPPALPPLTANQSSALNISAAPATKIQLDRAKLSCGFGKHAPQPEGSSVFIGRWSAYSAAGPAPQNPVTLTFDASLTLAAGAITDQDRRQHWNLVADSYVTLAYKRDMGTFWRNGFQQFTSRYVPQLPRGHTTFHLVITP